MLRSVGWSSTDVSGLPIGPVLYSHVLLGILSLSGMLRSVGWLTTDVSGLPIGPVLYSNVLLGHLTLKDGTDR
jgi:tetrahydromethanopterin S-methyltransferase subunit F